jgi:hypothetical protein
MTESVGFIPGRSKLGGSIKNYVVKCNSRYISQIWRR